MKEEVKDRLYQILYVANVLTDKESEVKHLDKQFSRMVDEIRTLVGFELWHTDSKGGKWFWMDKDKNESYRYDDRGWAIRMLIDNTIKWI